MGKEAMITEGRKRARTDRNSACHSCVRGKRKCDGARPCARCLRLGRECEDQEQGAQQKQRLGVALAPVVCGDAMMRLLLGQSGVIRSPRGLIDAFGLGVDGASINVEVPPFRSLGYKFFEKSLVSGRITSFHVPEGDPFARAAVGLNGEIEQFYLDKRIGDIAAPPSPGYPLGALTHALTRARPLSVQVFEFDKTLFNHIGGRFEAKLRMHMFLDEKAEPKWVVISVISFEAPAATEHVLFEVDDWLDDPVWDNLVPF